VSQRKLTGREDEGQGADPWTSDRHLSEFLLRACHDLKTPLRAIRTSAELLERNGDIAKQIAQQESGVEQRIRFIADGARRIDLLADGLASYSIALQIEESSFQFIRMDAVLRTALTRLREELSKHCAEVTSDELPRIFGNPDRLAQIFEILIRNALQYGDQVSPRIHITAEKHVEAWLFAVRDNGPGIESAWLDRIFRPFERLHGKQNEGAGLGLAIGRAIMNRHGGKLWAESGPESGSTFFFTLPVALQ
jgi:signal transduction histidine kinase